MFSARTTMLSRKCQTRVGWVSDITEVSSFSAGDFVARLIPYRKAEHGVRFSHLCCILLCQVSIDGVPFAGDKAFKGTALVAVRVFPFLYASLVMSPSGEGRFPPCTWTLYGNKLSKPVLQLHEQLQKPRTRDHPKWSGARNELRLAVPSCHGMMNR